MRRFVFPCLILLGLAGSSAFSATYGKGRLFRGGLGFVFPDFNSFVNPANLGIERGLAMQIFYERGNNSSANQNLIPSLVYGQGGFGVGVFFNRDAANLMLPPNTDLVGAAMGFSLLKERLSLGGVVDYNIGSVNAGRGSVTGSLILQSPRGKGPALSFASTFGLNDPARSPSLTLGLGYSFVRNQNLELNFGVQSFSTTSDYYAAGFFTVGGNSGYVGVGYKFANLNSLHTLSGRIGLNLGRYIDISALLSYTTNTAAQPNYGMTFRAQF